MDDFYYQTLKRATRYTFKPNLYLGDYKLWGNHSPLAQAYSIIKKHEEEWEFNEPNPLKVALEKYAQGLSNSAAKIKANCDRIEAVMQNFKVQVGKICKQIVQESHGAQLEQNMVVGMNLNEEEVVVEQEEKTTLERQKQNGSREEEVDLKFESLAEKVLWPVQDVEPHLCWEGIVHKEVIFDPGGIEKFFTLKEAPMIPKHSHRYSCGKPWDPGISFCALCLSWPLSFKQWDPGGSFSISFL